MYNTIKTSVDVLTRNNAPGLENTELIHSKRQPSNFNKLLTKVEFSNEEAIIE